MKTILLTGLALLAALPLAFAAVATRSAGPALGDEAQDAVVKAQRPAYPFRECLVSGKRFGDGVEPVAHVVQGRLFLVCSAECAKKVDASPETYGAKIDQAVIAEQTPIYPLTTCAVSGEELGSMGAPIDVVHGTRLVRLCCKSCKKGLTRNPDELIAKIDAALIEKLRSSYPLATCPISNRPLADSERVVDKLYGVTLVRLCCSDCVASYEKDPAKHAMRVQDAARGAQTREGSGR